jgi:branched-chain amino acid transport system ATP-binding protein
MLLEVENVRVRYRNGALGVLDISLTVAQGAIVAISGSNGAGKTTTVRAVSGFMRSEGARIISGSVRLDGANVTNQEPHRLRRAGVALVPETQKIFPNLTVADNLVALGALPSRVDRAEAYDRVFALFPALRDCLRTLAGLLSGGQQQMLALARNLLVAPRLLIMDEMTLGLHPSLHPPLFAAVRRIAATGTSVIVVDESAVNVLDVADYCYVLAGGEVHSEGKPDLYRGSELMLSGYLGD